MKPLGATIQTSYLGTISKLILVTLIIGLAIIVYSQWGSFVVATVEWQKTLHGLLASHISAVSENALKYGWALIALSFGYGVFHAVGPGHGKAVIITYLGTNKESIKKGIAISFAAAIMQSLIAVVLVSALARILKIKLSEVHNYGNDITMVSYALVIMLGGMLVFTSVRRIFKQHRSRQNQTHIHSRGHSNESDGHTHAGDSSEPYEHSHHHSNHHHSDDRHAHHNAHNHSHEHHDHSHSHSDHHAGEHTHSHDEACGCNHAHVPEENQSIWQTLAVILSMGIRPCSGAIVVLIYAHLVGVYHYGMIATLLMGVGTGLSVSLIAIGTQLSRSLLERLAADSNISSFFPKVSLTQYVRLVGGLVLVLLGWSLYSAASALTTGNHPLF